jgi:hypothetical protein
VSLDERNIIIVQTKAYRLGMYLMRQALFSRVLIGAPGLVLYAVHIF